jgi:hypothetical protein
VECARRPVVRIVVAASLLGAALAGSIAAIVWYWRKPEGRGQLAGADEQG